MFYRQDLRSYIFLDNDSEVTYFMEQFDLYRDIATRTGGDVYIGVVGPVRTGKSTFIKNFMQTLILPRIEDENRRKRVTDELPQSGDGKTIMTTQPKFVPETSVRVDFEEGAGVNVRLIDCVGYPVDEAMGYTEGEHTRLVTTPWSEEEMTFEQAAELGTRKVICDHSTIGVIITADGSITGIERESYRAPEKRVIDEMRALGKPFAVILNTKYPENTDVKQTAVAMEQEYGAPVLVKNVAAMGEDDFADVLSGILMQFPVRRVDYDIPKWLCTLPRESEIMANVLENVKNSASCTAKMGDTACLTAAFDGNEYIKLATASVNFGTGVVTVSLTPADGLFYRVLSERCGVDISDDFALINYIRQLTFAKSEYDKLKSALEEVETVGYGVVTPDMSDLDLQQPQVVKKNGRYSVRLKATAPSLHIMRVDVETEVSPMFGGEGDSEEVIRNWLETFGEDGEGIWDTNMFGKTLSALAKEGLETKIRTMPGDARVKLRKTLGKIVNEGKGGVLCILL